MTCTVRESEFDEVVPPTLKFECKMTVSEKERILRSKPLGMLQRGSDIPERCPLRLEHLMVNEMTDGE
jgi:hypothetical protein